MFRDGDKPVELTTINVLLADGGMGDHICSLVAVNYIANNNPWLNPLVWVPDYLLEFAKHVLPKKLNIRNYSTAKERFNKTLPVLTTQWKGIHSPMRTHPVDYAFHMLVDTHIYDVSKKNYLQVDPNLSIKKFDLPTNYVVVAPLSVEQVKRFHPVVINQISDYLRTKGYTPIYLGKEEMSAGVGPDTKAQMTPANYEKGINLINKTSILESAAVISKAKAFIGMDGGLVHVAGSTQTPIICGYTFISPTHNMPIRNGKVGDGCYLITPPESLKCRFCQTNYNNYFGKDLRECRYKDYQCVDYITFEKIKVELDKII